MNSNLYQTYKNQIVSNLQKELGYKNSLQVPRLKKVVANVGYGRQARETAFVEQIEKTLMAVTGQKPIHTKAKKSISNFKIQQGMNIGAMVTLRGKRMYDFVEKLITMTFPRVRDFRGLSAAGFDGQGNYTIGFKENIAFPEVTMESADKIHGLQVIVGTTAKNKTEALSLLKALGFPFKEKE